MLCSVKYTPSINTSTCMDNRVTTLELAQQWSRSPLCVMCGSNVEFASHMLQGNNKGLELMS